MSDEHLDLLLDRLNGGDPQAAEEIYRAYEPYMRMIVRRKLRASLRAKFDSMDIVQSVWSDVLDHFRRSGRRFADAAHLRAFLATATRNRFIDRLRTHQTALRCEESLDTMTPGTEPASAAPRPSEIVMADDLWDELLAHCPPAHHELLRLKRQGASIAEIAARTGLHEGSVRRILYDLASRVGLKKASAAASGR